MTTIADIIKNCISEHFDIPVAEITSSHTFDALGADSLDTTELGIDLEKKLGIDLPDELVFAETDASVDVYIATITKYIDLIPGRLVQIESEGGQE